MDLPSLLVGFEIVYLRLGKVEVELLGQLYGLAEAEEMLLLEAGVMGLLMTFWYGQER